MSVIREKLSFMARHPQLKAVNGHRLAQRLAVTDEKDYPPQAK